MDVGKWDKWEGIIHVTKTDGTPIKTVYRADGLNFRSKVALRGYLKSFGYSAQEATAYITLIKATVITVPLAQFKEAGIEI